MLAAVTLPRRFLDIIGALVSFAIAAPASAHPWHNTDVPPPGEAREALRAQLIDEWLRDQPQNTPTSPTPLVAPEAATKQIRPIILVSHVSSLSALRLAFSAASLSSQGEPPQAAPFQAFAPKVQLRWDKDFLYVGSNGIPDHNMMVGITNWQQQVPLPQSYFGDNAWRIPLHPVPARQSISIKGRFLRGAIALAVNGIPIFNPQNNRGEVSQEIGELDQWGGHCGRADDYHYHAAPLHLQSLVGKGQPIAYALDGYPIYGLTEPDGSPVGKLDECHGHDTPGLGYHYHASNQYPYVIAGFHGEVVERGEQVAPQPRANPVREALPPLRGAQITGFITLGGGKIRSLQYTVGGQKGAVNYKQLDNGSWRFQFVSTDGQKQEQTYTAQNRQGGGPGGPPPREGGDDRGADRDPPGGPPQDMRPPRENTTAIASNPLQKPNGIFLLTSPEVTDGGNLPPEFTGDGSGATLPIAWTGAPAGTKGYALIMDHLDREGVTKSYWVMWDIAPGVTSLPKNVEGVGKVGTSFKGQLGYEPPHSQGPGAKTYVLTIYALSSPVQISQPPGEVNREVLLAAMKDKVLASSSLKVVYTRSGNASNNEPRPPRPEDGAGPDGRRPPPGGPRGP